MQLALYQFKEQDIVQLTNGRAPFTVDADRAGWRLVQRVAATSKSINKITVIAPSKVLGEIQRQGYCLISRFEIEETWRKRFTVEGNRERQARPL